MVKLIFNNVQQVANDKLGVFSIKIISDCSSEYFLRIDGIDGQCFNCEGKDFSGKAFKKCIVVQKDQPKTLWFWVSVENDCSGYVCVEDADGKLIIKEKIDFKIDTNTASDALHKLTWLNSDYAIDDSVPMPFNPIKNDGNSIKILGREIILDDLGFPAQIKSYFNQSGKLCRRCGNLLSKPIGFKVNGLDLNLIDRKLTVFNDKVTMISSAESVDFDVNVSGRFEFDGFIRYEVELVAKNDIEVDDVNLNIALSKRYRTYFIGLGKKGGKFDGKLNWKWNKLHQDAFWCGDTDGGLRVSLQDENYQKPLVNIYYIHKPLQIPNSWGNNGKGGIKYARGAFKAYSGKRALKKGETLNFNFELMITPFKQIDLVKQFSNRYFHAMYDSDTWLSRAKEGGANVINVHHGNDLYPFINYPFVEEKALKEFVQKCHKKRIKAKIYYTIRELTINIPEFKALRDLDYEIIQKSNEKVDSPIWQGEAREWIRKTLGSDVIPAWRQPLKGKKYKDFFDSAIITDGQSRLCNFYIEGLKYMIDTADIDGIYVDDIAYDRETMKRVRKTLDVKDGAYIDFHTWDHYNNYGGMVNCAILYTSLFPYVDKLWVGEGFNYNYETHSPEYWLTEISGIPFGVMSEMMDAGNPWKGLLFGMTSRLGWIGELSNGDPRNIWELINKTKLVKSELIGWWDKRNPVSLSDERLRASVYKKGKKLYVAIANFSDENVETCIKLKGQNNFKLKTLYIKDLQEEKLLDCANLSIEPRGGLFVEIV